MEKRVKLVVVTPGSSGKSEILPRDDGRWAVRDFEYDDNGKRTKVNDQVVSHEELVDIIKADDRFNQAFLEFAREVL
jgi:hypothetical protein